MYKIFSDRCILKQSSGGGRVFGQSKNCICPYYWYKRRYEWGKKFDKSSKKILTIGSAGFSEFLSIKCHNSHKNKLIILFSKCVTTMILIWIFDQAAETLLLFPYLQSTKLVLPIYLARHFIDNWRFWIFFPIYQPSRRYIKNYHVDTC